MESQPSPTLSEPAETVATLAEDLPEIYRAILDRVADLERIGARGEAGRIRAEATKTYSDAWDEKARRRLLRLLANAQRGLTATERSRGWSIRRRPVAAR